MSGSYGIQSPAERNSAQALPQALMDARFTQWFAVQTRYQHERQVATQLKHKGFEVYLPVRTEQRAWSDRNREVTIPLFAGYAFVCIDQSRDAKLAVLQTAGLIGFVSFGGTAVAVPPKQIEDLQLLLQQKVAFSLHPFVHVGQRVRIRGGCLQGLEGVLMQHEKGRLIISIESIQRSLRVEIKGYEVDLA